MSYMMKEARGHDHNRSGPTPALGTPAQLPIQYECVQARGKRGTFAFIICCSSFQLLQTIFRRLYAMSWMWISYVVASTSHSHKHTPRYIMSSCTRRFGISPLSRAAGNLFLVAWFLGIAIYLRWVIYEWRGQKYCSYWPNMNFINDFWWAGA